MEESVLELTGVTKTVAQGEGSRNILDAVDLRIHRGEFVAVLGPSGSGKSTLLGLMAGLDRPTTGTVSVMGRSLTGMSEDQISELRGRSIGFVFQDFHLIPSLTARENVQVPLEMHGGPASVEDRSRKLLEEVGLGRLEDHYPRQMSGGEQQRVAIARALALDPPIMLADEPTGNLDRDSGGKVIDLLTAACSQRKITVVLVTHDLQLVEKASRCIRLLDGRVER